MGNWREKVDEAVFYIRKRAGQCAKNATLEDIDNAVSLAQGRIKQALFAGKFIQGQSGIFDKLSKANERLENISEGISKAKNTCIFIDEAGKIMDAVEILKDDRVIYDNPLGAAKAFDNLFQGFGKLCKRLPYPANQWAAFFEGFDLFSQLAPILIPETNPQHKEQWQLMERN
jgi:hypothetical protein